MKDWFMNIDEVQLITFSPTCTSKQVGEAIVHGTGISSVSKVDLTLEAAGKGSAFPCFGGHHGARIWRSCGSFGIGADEGASC